MWERSWLRDSLWPERGMVSLWAAAPSGMIHVSAAVRQGVVQPDACVIARRINRVKGSF
jgi:hypothetical protein